MRELEKERLWEMETCSCRSLDVRDSTTYTKEMIFENTSAEVNIYSYICKSCQQTFGFYADGSIPDEIVDIKKFAEELNMEFVMKLGDNPSPLICDDGFSGFPSVKWIIIRYLWETENGWKEERQYIFHESRD